MQFAFSPLFRQLLGEGVYLRECLGLSLILHQGLAAWIGAWLEIMAARPTTKITPSSVSRQTENDNVTVQIVSIIATMALNQERRVMHDTVR